MNEPAPTIKPEPQPGPPAEDRVGLLRTITSVLAAFFGVQSSRNRRRDFTRGNPLLFIAVGVVLTVMLVLGVVLAVHIALRHAGM